LSFDKNKAHDTIFIFIRHAGIYGNVPEMKTLDTQHWSLPTRDELFPSAEFGSGIACQQQMTLL